MESKTKKKLQFLNKEKSDELNENILNDKDNHTGDSKSKFEETYRTYLEHFPERKALFDYATKLAWFQKLSEILLKQIVDIFSQCQKGANKYAVFQIMWYTFSGNILNRETGDQAADIVLRAFISDIQRNVKNIADEDIRIYFSCVLKTFLDFYLHLTYTLKSHTKLSSKTEHKVFKVDETSVFRIAGSNLMRMIKKRRSSKFHRRFTVKRQGMLKKELQLLEQLHLSKSEKECVNLPAGIKFLDRGNLLIVKKPIFNFARTVIKKVCADVNSLSHQRLGLKMSQIAKLKLFDRQTKNMFLACLKLATGDTSLSLQCTNGLYVEYCTKMFNTLLNEYVKKDKFVHNNTAQLMLRDKLKFFATKSGSGGGKKKCA